MSAAQFDRAIETGTLEAPPAAAPPEPAAAPVGKVDAGGRPHVAPGHEKAGQFLPGKVEPPKDQPAPAAAGAGAQPPATPPGSPAEPAEAAATASVPDGYVRIEIPEALHRNFGKEKVVPKEDEAFVRWSINNHTRFTEVEQVRSAARTREQELLTELEKERQERLRLEAIPAANEKFRQSPTYAEIQAKIDSMQRAEDDGFLAAGTTAEYKALVLTPAQQKFETDEVASRVAAREQEQREADGQRWITDSRQRIWSSPEIPPEVTQLPEFEAWWQDEVKLFNHRLNDGYRPDIKTHEAAHNEFLRLFKARLMLEPTAVPLIRQFWGTQRKAEREAQERADAEARAAQARADTEAQRRTAEQAAAAAATNPLGTVPSTLVARSSGDAPRMSAKQFDRAMTRR